MSLKDVSFSGNRIIVGNKPCVLNDFDLIQDSTEKTEIKATSKEGKSETLNIKTISKFTFEGRFLCIYFLEGDKYPYAEKVMSGDNLEVVDNPRDPELIEMDKQVFVVVDITTQKIWLSDQRQKSTIMKWLAKVIKAEVEIKSILSEEEFITKLDLVTNIYFALETNLFASAEGTLSETLLSDMRGYEADVARVSFLYKSTKVSDNIRKQIANLFGRRSAFREICVVGKNDEGLDTVLNLDSVVTKIHIQADQDDSSKLLTPEQVFNEIILKIKQHGDTNET